MKSQHLTETNTTYIEHMQHAFYYSVRSLQASIMFFIHGIFPDIFTYSGSNIIKKLNKNFE
jgi:hypothetical protein